MQPQAVPEIKSPMTALLLSLGTTAAGYGLAYVADHSNEESLGAVGSLLLVIGPTTGHIYADNFWNTGLKVRLAGIGAALAGGILVLGTCPPLENDCSDADLAPGLTIVIAGAVLYVGGSIYEIATAPRSAREYNIHHAPASAFTIAPTFGRANGLALVGTF